MLALIGSFFEDRGRSAEARLTGDFLRFETPERVLSL
jgi:hypothetical protein